MYIIEDTRQKKGKHEKKREWWTENKVSVVRSKIPFGDYISPPKIAVDTKENMSEIAYNLSNTKNHIRIKNEMMLARDCGCKLIFLIENEDNIKKLEDVISWKNPRRFESSKAIKGEQLYKTMKTMSGRYGCEFQFCTPSESGERIIEILRKDD